MTIFALISLLVAPIFSSDNVQVSATVDRSRVQIADPFELKVEVVAPSGTKVGFPNFDKQIGSFDILDTKDDQSEASEENTQLCTWTRTFTLETLDSGDLRIPRIEVSVQEQDEKPQVLRTEPVNITVTSVVEANADLTKFNDIADLIDVEEPELPTSNVVWIAVAAGFALAAAAGCLAIAMRSPTFESSSAWALTRLRNANGDFNQVESILRGFLEEKFAFPAVSLGSAALVRELVDRGIEDSQVSALREIFEASERTKFGGYQLPDEQGKRMFEQAQGLIHDLDNVEVV